MPRGYTDVNQALLNRRPITQPYGMNEVKTNRKGTVAITWTTGVEPARTRSILNEYSRVKDDHKVRQKVWELRWEKARGEWVETYGNVALSSGRYFLRFLFLLGKVTNTC